jgi:hypothetical protein
MNTDETQISKTGSCSDREGDEVPLAYARSSVFICDRKHLCFVCVHLWLR